MPWVHWVSESMTHIFKVFLNRSPHEPRPWTSQLMACQQKAVGSWLLFPTHPFRVCYGVLELSFCEWKEFTALCQKYPLWVHECLMIAPAFSIEREGRRFITAPLKLDVHMWCNTASEIRTGAIHVTTGRSLLRRLEESISNLPLLYRQHQVGTCHYSSVLS